VVQCRKVGITESVWIDRGNMLPIRFVVPPEQAKAAFGSTGNVNKHVHGII